MALGNGHLPFGGYICTKCGVVTTITTRKCEKCETKESKKRVVKSPPKGR